MACNTKLPSDPEFLLQYMEDMDSDVSDDEFDSYNEEQGNDVCVDEETTTDVGMHEAMQVDEQYICMCVRRHCRTRRSSDGDGCSSRGGSQPFHSSL